MTPRPLSLAVTVSLCIPAIATAQNVTIEIIPQSSTALDMSPDGRYVVGGADQDGNGFQDGTYIYDSLTDTTTILPGPGLDATSVSDDGTVILGCMPDPGDGVEVAGRYTVADGWQSLGWLPDSLNCPSRSNGYDLSADGSVAVGLSWDGCSGRGFVWTQATGMLELESLANGSNRASVISSDGTVIGGFAQGSFSRTPAMWDGVSTTGDLLDPPNGDVVGEVQGMNDAGSVLLGNWAGDAYTWTAGGGTQIIGAGSLATNWVGIATDIADNGSIVGFDTLLTNRRGWIKPPEQSDLVAMNLYIINHGGTLPPNIAAAVVTGISTDGRTIVGHDFFRSAWMVKIEPACNGDLNVSGTVNTVDLLELLSGWGGDGPGADFAEPLDEVTVGDLLVLLSNWGDCGIN